MRYRFQNMTLSCVNGDRRKKICLPCNKYYIKEIPRVNASRISDGTVSSDANNN